MESMKAVVFHGPGDMRFETVPKPVPKEGEVCIKVKYAGICGSDVEEYKIGSDRAIPPIIFGHEFSGEIVEVGPGVSENRVGQRVSVNPILYCGECYYCKRGLINLCPYRRSIGRTLGVEKKRCDGAFAEYVCVPEFALVPLRDDVTFEEGALLEPLAVCLSGAKKGSFGEGESVLVIGAGPIGLMTIQFLKAMKAGNIVATDIVDSKLETARKIGADHVLNVKAQEIDRALDFVDGIGFDRVIIAAGVPSSLSDALRLVRSGGRIVMVGMIRKKIEIDPLPIVGREITVYGSYMFTKEMHEVMDYLSNKMLNVKDIITSVCSLEELPDMFKKLASDSEEIKVLVKVA
ncbi:MAG: galactitol-1-phosphate 5-dehydrogenase [Synergistetes bacterium]|nr:MAG: Alcohol dehydrogenase zinc-binding domain protein [bacterium 42_11]MBC7330911.1 galactitol-1-phosphate 5-dehydrogenase [Synergistota bacterium]MDK2870872.1 hypothetical protein [bacterium]